MKALRSRVVPHILKARKGIHVKKKEPAKLGDILSSLTKTTKLGKQLEQAGIWEHWPELAGPHLAEHGRPARIKDNVLHIEVDSPVWMHKFAFRKWDIIKRVNLMARRELVSDLFLALEPEKEEETP